LAAQKHISHAALMLLKCEHHPMQNAPITPKTVSKQHCYRRYHHRQYYAPTSAMMPSPIEYLPGEVDTTIYNRADGASISSHNNNMGGSGYIPLNYQRSASIASSEATPSSEDLERMKVMAKNIRQKNSSSALDSDASSEATPSSKDLDRLKSVLRAIRQDPNLISLAFPSVPRAVFGRECC
jgi:hypothetical protein